MANTFFRFKRFIIHQDKCAMKVSTDACLFGALLCQEAGNRKLKIENALDIGTGSGLLSLMFAQKNPGAHIDAIEIDKDAAEQASENIMASPWKDRMNVINADVKTFEFSKKYNLIFSNPPFYENELKAAVQKKNIAYHSENLKLEELLGGIKKSLAPEGVFYLLLPYKRNSEVKQLLQKKYFHIEGMTFFRQSVNHDFFRIMVMGKHTTKYSGEVQPGEISIWDENQQYTYEFIQLMKDFYLNL